jgi:hypothetical protein
MKRTWYRQQSDGTVFRNCPLIREDQQRLVNRLLPWRWESLEQEWRMTLRAGVTRAATLPHGDRYIDWNDSPEATEAWVRSFLALQGGSRALERHDRVTAMLADRKPSPGEFLSMRDPRDEPGPPPWQNRR